MSNLFTLGDGIPEETFAPLLAMLTQKRLPNNHDRKKSGFGRSQCFGIVKSRGGSYVGSRQNFNRPEVLMELQRIAQTILPPDFVWTSVQVNDNYKTAPHKDTGNFGVSAIVGFGNYGGGELVIEETPVNIRHQLCFFDGSLYTHHTKDYTGSRFSLVFFKPAETFREVPQYSMTRFENKDVLTESLGGVVRYINKKGVIVWASDNNMPGNRQRKPILRACL